MKKRSNLLATLLTLLVLVSAGRLTFSNHFCGGDFVSTSISLGQDNHSCCDKKAPSEKKNKKDCCHNETFSVNTSDEVTVSFERENNISGEKIFTPPYYVKNTSFSVKNISFCFARENYPYPPPKERSVYLSLLQTYLI